MQAQGNKAFQAGQFEEAIKHFTEAINLDPSNHVLYSNRSASHVSKNPCVHRPPATWRAIASTLQLALVLFAWSQHVELYVIAGQPQSV